MASSPQVPEPTTDQSLPAWQFFLLCGMLSATAVVVVATGQHIANVVILSLTVIAASFVGLAAYRTIGPLVTHVLATAPVVAGGRTRAALEREKTLVLRSIKELEFDFAMGKISQADFDDMGGRLRQRAVGLMQQLDHTAGYRERIAEQVAAAVAAVQPTVTVKACPSCATPSDDDARFCKRCGTALKS
jgi:hypothetical protein